MKCAGGLAPRLTRGPVHLDVRWGLRHLCGGLHLPTSVPGPEGAHHSIANKKNMTGEDRDHGRRCKALFLPFEQGLHILVLHWSLQMK